MQKWEYKYINLYSITDLCKKLGIQYTSDINTIFNFLGSNGWELVTSSGDSNVVFVFKRPVEN